MAVAIDEYVRVIAFCRFDESLFQNITAALELLNWVLVVVILSGFFGLALLFVPVSNWLGAIVGLGGFDLPEGRFCGRAAGPSGNGAAVTSEPCTTPSCSL